VYLDSPESLDVRLGFHFIGHSYLLSSCGAKCDDGGDKAEPKQDQKRPINKEDAPSLWLLGREAMQITKQARLDLIVRAMKTQPWHGRIHDRPSM
jgi:hypothetical protein